MRYFRTFSGGGKNSAAGVGDDNNNVDRGVGRAPNSVTTACSSTFYKLNSSRLVTTAFLILLLVSLKLDLTEAVRQNPLKDPKICGRPQCEPLSSKFKYGDNIYKYDYTVNLRTEFFGSGSNTSDLFLKANIDLMFPKPCEGFLRINQVKLRDKIEEKAVEDESTTASSDDNIYDYDYGNFNSEETPVNMDGYHPKSSDLEMALKKYILRFAFHDGHIGEVCPETEEPAWVLNFKKGILSSFQNTMLRFDVDFNTTETDVSGECDVHYSLEDARNIFVSVRKVKDIASCRKRYSTESFLQSTPYNFRDDKTIWPILNSESDCNMTIDNNIYKEITCRERHLLIPFSNSSSGAVTTVESKLELQSEETYSSGEFLAEHNDYIEKRSPLVFDHTPAVKPTHGDIKIAREMLKEMCSYGFPNIQREFIDVFTSFLQTTKHLDYKALTQLLARAASICENGKNHVLESLPYIGSTASYQVMRDQIINNEVNKFLAHNWMTSLSFIQRPDDETLDTFYTILEFSRKKVDPEYTLGASAVIHNYCRHNSGCDSNLKVQRIVNLMETEFLSLLNMFKGERKSRERMIVILKAVGNIGVISDDFAEALSEIIAEESNLPVDMRLESVLAFRRVNCMKYRQFFINTYANHSINSEVRISSYLQAMRCPDYISIAEIKAILETEEINQVGSFVWSHLKNLAKSNSPVRIEAQGLLLNDDLSDRFKMDIRKFSRNYEHSLFFDEYNFGTTTDLNVIFGTDSFLPKTTNLNFTADLFGQSVNFFELSLRAEGFEELVAAFFGPKGPLNRELFRKKLSFLNRWLGNESSEDDDTLDNLLNMDNLRFKRDTEDDEETEDPIDLEMEDNDYDYKEENQRRKRSVNDPEAKKSAIKADINKLGYKLKYDYSNPKAQFGLRIFGNDLRFQTMEGMREVFMAFKELDPLHQISKILSGKVIQYTKSRVFLDASYNAPLGIGLPLSIHAFGASSVDMRISGYLDRLDPVSDWYFDVEGRFKPSISVDVITTMKSDMYYATSGIKVKSNLYSHSEVETKLKVRGPNLVSFAFNLPQDTNEIFSARSELLVMKDETEIPQEGIQNRRENTTCTWPVLDAAVGLQMCSYFSVPDLSNSSDIIYPSLLLSGPLNFSMILKKSDLSAKKFVFEYKWEQENNDTNWSLVFHTPGSSVKRMLVSNVTTTLGAFNASVSFINGANRALAGCNYNGDPDHRHLDVFLDTNGNRSFDLNMELLRRQDRYISVYSPRMLLAINGVNVTGLIGTVKINEKNGIMQSDFDLSFETKKLQALLRGNLVQSEITTSTNMTINYRFQANQIETVNFEGKLVNFGDKSKTEYRSNVKLRTSAYPKLNFASNGTFLTLQGHTEAVLTHNNSPNFDDPNYTNSLRLVFARSYSEDHIWEGSRTRASFEAKFPRKDVDFRILIKHEERYKNGSEHNVLIGLRYAPEKEATGLFSVHLPLRNLFAIDAYMNVTVPEFNSCTARFKVTERIANDYNVFFNGSWFTGHSINIKGSYKDRSSRVQARHQLKLVVESPSFNVTSLNVIYRRNQLLWFADIQSTYGTDPYALSIQFDRYADNKNANGKARLKLKDKEFWINSELLSDQPKKLLIEIHLDRLRDIHLGVSLLSLEKRKEVSLEFKWDANRDPSQRLGLLAEFDIPADKHYDGNFMVTYPDRTVSCGFEAYTGGPKYYGSARASWSINDMITFRYNAGLLSGKNINSWVHAELITPFESWRRNSIEAGVYNNDNLILANSTLVWAEDQNLALFYQSDYEMIDPLLRFDIQLGINSSINDIPTIGFKVKHKQDSQNFDSEFDLRYTGINDTLNIYSIKSIWEYLHNIHHQILSGTVVMQSPFEGYRRGGLAAKFMLNNQRQISGAATLNFDIREFTLAMDGYVKKFSDNMLTINITTPLERFQIINGRFGLNEKKRHAVAEVRAPSSALGAEVLCDIISLMDFDTRLSIATPIETFQQVAIHAKLKPENVDIRGKLNNATIGFIGVWRMVNITDFEYSYQVFTPLAGFEHNGFIAKLIKRDVFIFHLHGMLSHYKLGVKINGHPKSKPLKQLGSKKVNLEMLYDEDFNPQPADDEDYDFNDLDYDEFFSYFVNFEFDTLKWPTIDGVMDIQEISDFYLIVGNVQLPQGRVDLKDRVYFPDYINILNVLTMKTPFPQAKDVKVVFEYHVDLNGNYFREKINFIFSDILGKQTEAGFFVNYTKTMDPLKPRQHDLILNVKTPFEPLDGIHIIGRLDLEENIYKGNITSKTNNTLLSLAASVETEENYLETSVGILLETNVIPHYACQAYFKKDLSETDNFIDIQFEVTDNGTINKLQIESAWHKQPSHLINASGKVRTTMLPLQLAETSIVISKDPYPQLSYDLGFLSQTGKRIDYGARANRKRDIFNIELWTPMENYRNISMHGSLTKEPNKLNRYIVSGNLYRNMAAYAVKGTVDMDNDIPSDLRLRIQPKSGGIDGVIDLTITKPNNQNSAFSYRFSAIEDGKMCQISGGFSSSPESGMDFSVLIESSEPEISRIDFHGRLTPKEQNNRYIGTVSLTTPWRELGIESVKLNSDIGVSKTGGKLAGEYYIGNNIGRGSCIWSWILAENMQLILESYMERPNANPRIVHASAKYLNPDKNFQRLFVGGKLNVDSKWNLEVNGTGNYRSSDDFQASLDTQLPEPVGDIHRLGARYRGNLISNQMKDPNIFFEVKYLSDEAQRKFLAKGFYRNLTDLQGMGHAEWGIADNLDVIEGDFQMLRKPEVRREFYAKLITPKFKNENTFALSGNYDLLNKEYHNLVCALDYPASARLADMDVSFKTLSNMNGFVNTTLPFLNVTWFKADFNFSTNGGESYRFCEGTWPTDTAFFKLKSNYDTEGNKPNLQGNIEMEVPLATRHRADIIYSLKEEQSQDNGHLKVNYNRKQILDGLYKRQKKNVKSWVVETTDISLENDRKPLGIHYVNKRNIDINHDDFDVKHIELFELRNTANFNLTGELHSKIKLNSQEFKVVAIHPNRTVTIITHYDEPNEHEVKQRTKVELSPTAWIGYNIEIGNYTTIGNESQKFLVELSYPKRNLSSSGWYTITDQRFHSDVGFKWTSDNSYGPEEKNINTSLVWQVEPLRQGDRDHQTFVFTLGHPLLEKDVTLSGRYYRGLIDLLKANLAISYSNDPVHLIELGAHLKDHYQELGHLNYTFKFFAVHEASEIDVQMNGTLAAKPSYYKTESHAVYKRGYFPEKRGQFIALLDMNKKEIDYLRVSPYRTVRFWAIPTIRFPVYGLNATVWDTPDTNNTGYIYVDILNKAARMEVNLTEDASQNLQMVGYIPDTRSGFLDVWRNYEEIRIIDITSYLKMNHSRLITGRFHWRPKIKQEVKEKFNAIGNSLYNSFSEGIDFWIKSLYGESTDAIAAIWETTKEYNKPFLDDVSELRVLEKDLEEFRIFVNQSYEANDFYIKTLVSVTLSILDELAIRDHIESLPKIFTEIWQAMGESGKALRSSIVWLIETVKTSYNKIMDAISRFFHGESLKYLSAMLEKGIEKYDKIVKDLHISFIKYVEQLWNKFSYTMANYWKSVLKRFEPHIFKFMSVVEDTAWKLSKELFEFIYKRTNELAESPYFNQVSSFTQNVERLYKDIMSNDALTNIKKYSAIVWNFVKEKYFKLVPFGTELNEVLTEILDEVKQLQKIEQIQFFVQKYHELEAKLEWIAEELQLEDRLHQLYALISNKLRNYNLNAIETSDMYREAKTKFVFDPDTGVIDLEQKLPMSWHAFNETPRFEEIPEYRWLAKAQNFFSTTNSSMIRYIYNLRSHLDPKTWLPPYYSRALLIDTRHYMTFDKRFVDLNVNTEANQRQCSYLLAHDFFRNNFTLIMEPKVNGLRGNEMEVNKLIFVASGQYLEIDFVKDTLTLNGDPKPMLPTQIDGVVIHRDSDILAIYSDTEFTLSCNMQFDLCWFEVSGWYFGQTAGLLGTMNNEHYDEYTMPNRHVVNNSIEFTDSWSFKQCRQKQANAIPDIPAHIVEVCQNFFKSGIFSACSDTIDPKPFYDMCLDLGRTSAPVQTNHPAIKGACTAALAYIDACTTSKIPMRVPDQCVFCQLSNGTFIPEGTFVDLSGSDVPRSSDVVFIVEAKQCNVNLTERKSIMNVVAALEEQFTQMKITNNRYAVVTFGGKAPFDKPRTLIQDDQVFVTDFAELEKYFAHVETFNGLYNDTLQAISHASKLNFRPGVSKTFILLSCSNCAARSMRLDSQSILQFMREEGVNLHILADTEFEFERTRKLRHFFGLDRDMVYSKRFPEGDVETRKQLRIPKGNLGVCTHLAMDTDGSVFSARKLMPERKYPIRRLAAIFAKRVAKSAVPLANQTCECSGHNTGVAYIACSPRAYPQEKIDLDDYDLQFNDFEFFSDEEDM